MPDSVPFTMPFEKVSLDDLALVGGKNASLGELTQNMGADAVNVPGGFAVTTAAFQCFMEQNDLNGTIRGLLDGLDKADMAAFQERGAALRSAVLATPFPVGVERAIISAYERLLSRVDSSKSVAVRSSATAEDLPGLSFAGQHDSFLFIKNSTDLLNACKHCYASLYNDRALSYRLDQGIDHMSVYLSVGVQIMIQSDEASSGVIFTIDPESGSRQSVLISAVYGTGEAIVQGLVEPDEYYVHKQTFIDGNRCVYRHKMGEKHLKTIAGGGDFSAPFASVPIPVSQQHIFCLTDEETLELAAAAISIEKRYSTRYGRDTPMDIEWAKDANDNRLYILQARPETVHALANTSELVSYSLESHGETLVTGVAVGRKIASGTARHIVSIDNLERFQKGDILIAETTSPDWEPIMKLAAAIVTDHGGRTCHSAIVARELGIPAIVGTITGTQKIADGMAITVSCAEGETGRVMKGNLPIAVTKTNLDALAHPKTKVMVNIANPELASQVGCLPCDGVGLARTEFIIANTIGAHPMALLNADNLVDLELRDGIAGLIDFHKSGKSFFVTALAEGVATIAAALYPRPVIVRTSDFKSNEYAALVGGELYEENEENPMIGFRGAARYIHPDYADAFALECEAFKWAREEMGFRNIKLMIPFCRTITEAETVLSRMKQYGLNRGEHDLEIYMMCEIPSNVLLIDEFSRLFDGFSIGSNDLTQLVLGVDRDSSKLASTFDERDPAVLSAIKMAVQGARRNDKPIGICGQAPSDYPDFTRFLVEHGIDSISVTSDSFFETLQTIYDVEVGAHAKTVSRNR